MYNDNGFFDIVVDDMIVYVGDFFFVVSYLLDLYLYFFGFCFKMFFVGIVIGGYWFVFKIGCFLCV